MLRLGTGCGSECSCLIDALALKLELPVWTQDKDHTDAGIEVFTTGDLLDALRDAGHDPDLA